jgi:hypothetical protein
MVAVFRCSLLAVFLLFFGRPPFGHLVVTHLTQSLKPIDNLSCFNLSSFNLPCFNLAFLTCLVLIPGVSRVLHSHSRVQTFQGSLRQNNHEAPAKWALLVNDLGEVSQRPGKQWNEQLNTRQLNAGNIWLLEKFQLGIKMVFECCLIFQVVPTFRKPNFVHISNGYGHL